MPDGKREWKVLTAGQKLQAILSLKGDSGIGSMDYNDMRKLAADLYRNEHIEPEKACIVDFTQKDLERINVLFNRYFLSC